MECAIKLSVSSTIIILFQFKKSTQKLIKVQNIENGKFDEKSAQNKKDVKFDFASDMFYKIFCILNRIKNFIVFGKR